MNEVIVTDASFEIFILLEVASTASSSGFSLGAAVSFSGRHLCR
jgi:hypothetical protein